jgi:tetratricopeptide (TPR) repeat protein
MNENLTPEQLELEGKEAYQKKDYLEAARLFGKAADGFGSVGEALSAAENKNNQSVALLMAGDAQGAFDAADGTPVIFELAGDSLRQAMALGNLGSALNKMGKLSEAIAAFEQADELLRQLGEHDLRAPILQELAGLKLRTGRRLESIGAMNASLHSEAEPGNLRRFLRKLYEVPLKYIFRI